MGKKIIDFKTQRVASRGRKSKAGGEKIKSNSIIYTPVKKSVVELNCIMFLSLNGTIFVDFFDGNVLV